MKQSSKIEVDLVGMINSIQSQILVLDKKLDSLLDRSLPQAKPTPNLTLDHNRTVNKPNDRNNERVMYAAICADCQKECKIPFKPSGDRPVYCQDCFSRRKVMNLAGMSASAPKVVEIQKPQALAKKKTTAAKKPVAKKKAVPKKK